MAGVGDEIELEEAVGIASFLVLAGRVPPATAWVESMIEGEIEAANEAFATSAF